jgi:hypothetical protein
MRIANPQVSQERQKAQAEIDEWKKSQTEMVSNPILPLLKVPHTQALQLKAQTKTQTITLRHILNGT